MVPCGVAATLAGVPSEDLAAVACEMDGVTRAAKIGLSDRPGVRALIQTMESVNSGEPWTVYIKSLHACWSYLASFRDANHSSLSDNCRPVSPSFGWCDRFNNLFLPCLLFYSVVSFFFYVRRSLAVGTSSRYRKHVQQ